MGLSAPEAAAAAFETASTLCVSNPGIGGLP